MLTLGPVTFERYEIPERINFGGQQDLKKHKLLGGARVVDALGPDEHPIKWAGRFQGSNAMARARQLDALRMTGARIPLTWGAFFYFVVISDFVGNYEAFYQIPYTIECVVTDQPGVGFDFGSTSLDALVASDLGTVAALISAFRG